MVILTQYTRIENNELSFPVVAAPCCWYCVENNEGLNIPFGFEPGYDDGDVYEGYGYKWAGLVDDSDDDILGGIPDGKGVNIPSIEEYGYPYEQ